MERQRVHGRSVLHHAAITVFEALWRVYGPIVDKFRLPYLTSLLAHNDRNMFRPLVDFGNTQLQNLWKSLDGTAKHHAIQCFVDSFYALVELQGREHWHCVTASKLYDQETFH